MLNRLTKIARSSSIPKRCFFMQNKEEKLKVERVQLDLQQKYGRMLANDFKFDTDLYRATVANVGVTYGDTKCLLSVSCKILENQVKMQKDLDILIDLLQKNQIPKKTVCHFYDDPVKPLSKDQIQKNIQNHVQQDGGLRS